jgi:hypothetical protein
LPPSGKLESPSGLSNLDVNHDEISRDALENREYTTTLGLRDRVTVKATLGVEDFLGRMEFILAINIRKESE